MECKEITYSRSNTEAEYHAMGSTTAKSTWPMHVLRDIRLYLGRPSTLFCDNVSAFHLIVNHVLHARISGSSFFIFFHLIAFQSFHLIAFQALFFSFFFFCEKVAFSALVTHFVPFDQQVTDIFTKALSHQPFTKCRFKLGL